MFVSDFRRMAVEELIGSAVLGGGGAEAGYIAPCLNVAVGECYCGSDAAVAGMPGQPSKNNLSVSRVILGGKQRFLYEYNIKARRERRRRHAPTTTAEAVE